MSTTLNARNKRTTLPTTTTPTVLAADNGSNSKSEDTPNNTRKPMPLSSRVSKNETPKSKIQPVKKNDVDSDSDKKTPKKVVVERPLKREPVKPNTSDRMQAHREHIKAQREKMQARLAQYKAKRGPLPDGSLDKMTADQKRAAITPVNFNGNISVGGTKMFVENERNGDKYDYYLCVRTKKNNQWVTIACEGPFAKHTLFRNFVGNNTKCLFEEQSH